MHRAQRAKVDAQAARELRRLRKLLGSVVTAGDVGRAWAAMGRCAEAKLHGVVDALERRGIPAELARALRDEIDETLEEAELSGYPEDAGLPATEHEDPVLCLPKQLTPSPDVTSARARLARLQAQRIKVEGRLEAGMDRWRTGWRPWHDLQQEQR